MRSSLGDDAGDDQGAARRGPSLGRRSEEEGLQAELALQIEEPEDAFFHAAPAGQQRTHGLALLHASFS